VQEEGPNIPRAARRGAIALKARALRSCFIGIRLPANHDKTAGEVAKMPLWTCASFAAPAALKSASVLRGNMAVSYPTHGLRSLENEDSRPLMNEE